MLTKRMSPSLPALVAAPFVAMACGVAPADVCTVERTDVRWDEEVPTGDVPAQLLAPGEGRVEVEADDHLRDDRRAALLEIDIARRGDHAIFVDKSGYDHCLDSVELPITMAIKSDDGSLDESFDIVSRASTPDRLALVFSVEPDEIAGAWTPTAPEGSDVVDVEFFTEFTRSGQPTGHVGTWVRKAGAQSGGELQTIYEW